MATQQSERSYQNLQQSRVKEWIADHGLKDIASDTWSRLARSVTADAAEYAQSSELSLQRWGEFDELLNEALRVVASTMLAANGGWVADCDKIKSWSHYDFALEIALRSDAPIIMNDSIKGAAAEYLDLPFRSERMDYILVELLVACELFAFAREKASILKQATLGRWAKTRLYSALFYFALALAADWLFDAKWGTLLFWIYVAETVLTTIPLFRPTKVAKLLQEMNGVYCELTPSGPYSARHIDYRAKRAADMGVVWPAPLFALLDDIVIRGGMF